MFHNRAFPDSVDALVLQFCHFPFDITSQLGGNSSSAQMQSLSRSQDLLSTFFLVSLHLKYMCISSDMYFTLQAAERMK